MATRKSSRPGGLRTLVRGYPVPGSSALYVPLADDMEDYTGAIIRCGAGHARLYDLQLAQGYTRLDTFTGRPMYGLRMIAERECSRCGQKCERTLTITDGEAVGDDGAWTCPRCARERHGGHLARIVAPKGRIILRCPKCKADIRVNTPVMFRELRRQTLGHDGDPF